MKYIGPNDGKYRFNKKNDTLSACFTCLSVSYLFIFLHFSTANNRVLVDLYCSSNNCFHLLLCSLINFGPRPLTWSDTNGIVKDLKGVYIRFSLANLKERV